MWKMTKQFIIYMDLTQIRKVITQQSKTKWCCDQSRRLADFFKYRYLRWQIPRNFSKMNSKHHLGTTDQSIAKGCWFGEQEWTAAWRTFQWRLAAGRRPLSVDRSAFFQHPQECRLIAERCTGENAMNGRPSDCWSHRSWPHPDPLPVRRTAPFGMSK